MRMTSSMMKTPSASFFDSCTASTMMMSSLVFKAKSSGAKPGSSSWIWNLSLLADTWMLWAASPRPAPATPIARALNSANLLIIEEDEEEKEETDEDDIFDDEDPICIEPMFDIILLIMSSMLEPPPIKLMPPMPPMPPIEPMEGIAPPPEDIMVEEPM